MVFVGVDLVKQLLNCLFAHLLPHKGCCNHKLVEFNAMIMRLILLSKYLLDILSGCHWINTKSVLDAFHKFLEVDFPVFIFV